jgi:hypothetical protein
MQAAHLGGLLQVLGPVQVGAVEQAQELRVLEIVVPGEYHQSADCLRRIDLGQVQRLLGLADVLVGGLEHGAEQFVLAAEVVIQHALVGAGQCRDAVDPRTTQTDTRELGLGGGEDARARLLGVAHGARFALRRHRNSLTAG